MKVYDFNVIEASEKTESLNLSEYGKTWCLNVCLSGYFVMLLRAIVSGSAGLKVLAVAGVIVWTLLMLSNNNLLGGRRK